MQSETQQAQSIRPPVRVCALLVAAMFPLASFAQSENRDSTAAQNRDSTAAQNRNSSAAQSTSRTATSSSAAASGEESAKNEEQRRSQPNPYARADDSWISLSGTVGNVQPNSFWLDYGTGTVRVEMDDGDRDADAYVLNRGDKVTVNGLIDDDFFEVTKIEASSVYVDKLGTYFYSSALDEEDYHTLAYPVSDGDFAAIHGRVTEVNGDEFTIDIGARRMTVDVDEMAYNPLDSDGYQQVDVGDVVRVTGQIDDDFLEGRELKARTVTTLVDGIG